MDIHLKIDSLPGYPELSGAHGLAWSYLLDTIFADAYHAKVASLQLVLPSAALEHEATLRVMLSPPKAAGTGEAVAALGAVPEEAGKARRLYTLHYGLLAPRHLRNLPSADPNTDLVEWVCEGQLFVLTWQVRALGVSMRFWNGLRQPQLGDRAMFAMRHAFATPTPTLAFYELRSWGRP